MVESKWVNGGIAVAFAGVLTGLAVWMSSRPPVEQSPRDDQPVQVNEAPPDRLGPPPTRDRIEHETEAAPPDMGGLKPPTKD